MKTKTLTLLFIFLSIFCFGQTSEKFSVYFKFNKHELDNNSKSRIDSFMNSKNIEHISLQGHTDYEGNDEYNDELSLKRVGEVKTYLLSKNINDSTIEVKALGKRKLINSSKDQNEKALNRRVEIELTIKAKEIIKPVKKDTLIPTVKLLPNQKEIIINGLVTDDEKKPLVTEITLSDKNGNEISVFKSDSSGKYKFKTILTKKEDYSLTYYNDETFIGYKRINVSMPRFPHTNLRTVLHKLKGGNKYILENLNFVGDTNQLIPESLPSLEALYKLMKKNKKLVIRIEGHVNYPKNRPNPKKRSDDLSSRYFPPEFKTRSEVNQWLSDVRAKMVLNYLIEKGIDASRLSSIGFSNSQMLFPDAVSDSEQAQNRRVEINVISFK